jgi:SAM-dependent methyltransferase
MIYLVGYFILLIIELIIAIGLSVFAVSMLYSSFKGSPYVPTKLKEVIDIMTQASLKKGSVFIELGCGDGRAVREAVKRFGVKGTGVDINPVLILWAKILSWWKKVKGVRFKVENIFDTDLRKADYVYLFLMPELIESLKPKLKKEMKKGAVVISHGFNIHGWDKYRYKFMDHKPFPTYFYRLP